jgi:hypothetical protein
MDLHELLKMFRLRPSNQEAKRFVDSEERAWVEYMPSQQDERPPH